MDPRQSGHAAAGRRDLETALAELKPHLLDVRARERAEARIAEAQRLQNRLGREAYLSERYGEASQRLLSRR